MFIGSKEIRRLIEEENLVSDYINLDEQLQPDGFDLTVNKLEIFCSEAVILPDRKTLPKTQVLEPISLLFPTINDYISFDVWQLSQGVYQLYFNETIKLPKSVSSIHIQRSTLMRSATDTAIGTWDMGYNGKGCTLLDVKNPHGLWLGRNTRVVKMQFVPVTEGFMYDGSYQKENIK
jgi:dUTP pyrophosphatase